MKIYLHIFGYFSYLFKVLRDQSSVLQKSLTTIIGGDNKERVAPLAEAVGRLSIEMQIIGTLPDLDAVGGFHVEFVAGFNTEEVVPVIDKTHDTVHTVVVGGVGVDFKLVHQSLLIGCKLP